MESDTFIASWGEFRPTLKDMVSLTMLPIYRERKSMGEVLKGEDEDKLHSLTSAMAASKTSGKSSYATWYFDEGERTQSELVLEAQVQYWFSSLVLYKARGSLKCLYAILLRLDEFVGNTVCSVGR